MTKAKLNLKHMKNKDYKVGALSGNRSYQHNTK